MASANKVILIGNLTRDPEVKYTPKGSAIAEFSLAINHKYKTDFGEQREEVTFVECTAWGKTAELAGQYLSKGRPLYVEGRLKMDSWEDKQTGQKRSKLKVIVDNMQFLGSRDSEGGGGGERRDARPASTGRWDTAPSRSREPEGCFSSEIGESDIPF